MPEELQIRMTHRDAIRSQKQLRHLVIRKIERNVGLSRKEEEFFDELVATALLSQGSRVKAYHMLPDGRKLYMGTVHSFALWMCDLKGSEVTLRNYDRIYKVQIKNLWKTLYKYFIELFPIALDEAIHMSREVTKREPPSAYTFSPDKRLDEN